MVNFRPSAPPAWKATLRHPATHIAVLTVVVFSSIFFIRQKQREELRNRVALLKSGPVLVERGAIQASQASGYEENTESEEAAEVTELATTEVPQGNSSNESIQVAASGAWAASGPATQANDPQAPRNPTVTGGTAAAESARSAFVKMKVTYAEIDSNTLNSWIQESRGLGQLRSFDGVTMGTLSQIQEKLANAKVTVLQTIDRTFENVTTAEWFVGTHTSQDLENEAGLFTSIAITDPKDGMLRGDIEVQRALKDFKDLARPTERTSFGSTFEMTAQSGYFMSGLLPRKALGLEEESQIDGALKVLNSRSFMNRETEFTLIFAFDTPTASER